MKRIVIIIAALFFGLVGLGMSLCGGGFLLAALKEDLQRKSNEVSGIAAIALPSLLIGIGVVWICWRILLKHSDGDPPDETNRS